MPDVTQVRGPIRTARYRQVRITVIQGPDRGRSIDVAGREIRIGTEVENDFVLNDEAVSRVHCALEPTALGLRVRDEGSTNGVWFAGTRIFDALISSSSVVLKLGDTELRIVPLDVTVERQLLELDRFGQMIGRSQRIRELFADLQRIASVDVSVLIEGETGTGKELVAEAIHDHSARAGKPFVVFDCGAVAPTLAESELFGHVRGAFTGAVESRAGVFEQADGGTIFLDELGELPRELQPKLLRVLEKREVRRLGSAKAIPVDVRLVAATNRNLAAEVQRGTFRDDLFFRIACAQISVPALRARMDDLPLLVEHFMRHHDPSASVDSIPKLVWDMFRAHRWPGNVRELKNAVQRLLLTPDRPFAEWPGASVPMNEPAVCQHVISLREARQNAIDSFENSYLKFVLHKAEGNITRAAASVEISRQMFHKLLRKHAID